MGANDKVAATFHPCTCDWEGDAQDINCPIHGQVDDREPPSG